MSKISTSLSPHCGANGCAAPLQEARGRARPAGPPEAPSTCAGCTAETELAGCARGEQTSGAARPPNQGAPAPQPPAYALKRNRLSAGGSQRRQPQNHVLLRTSTVIRPGMCERNPLAPPRSPPARHPPAGQSRRCRLSAMQPPSGRPSPPQHTYTRTPCLLGVAQIVVGRCVGATEGFNSLVGGFGGCT